MPKLQNIVQIVYRNARAKKALATLVKEGCNEQRLLQLVYDYCRGATAEESEKSVQSARGKLDRWRQLSEDLPEEARITDMVINELAQEGVMVVENSEYRQLPTMMREFADLLGAAVRTLKSGVNARSGNNGILVYLCYCVKAATRDEHYREIAALEMVFKGSGARTPAQLTLEADAIRNRVARYEESFKKEKGGKNIPAMDPQHLREEAEEEVSEWPESKKE